MYEIAVSYEVYANIVLPLHLYAVGEKGLKQDNAVLGLHHSRFEPQVVGYLQLALGRHCRLCLAFIWTWAI